MCDTSRWLAKPTALPKAWRPLRPRTARLSLNKFASLFPFGRSFAETARDAGATWVSISVGVERVAAEASAMPGCGQETNTPALSNEAAGGGKGIRDSPSAPFPCRGAIDARHSKMESWTTPTGGWCARASTLRASSSLQISSESVRQIRLQERTPAQVVAGC